MWCSSGTGRGVLLSTRDLEVLGERARTKTGWAPGLEAMEAESFFLFSLFGSCKLKALQQEMVEPWCRVSPS